MTYLAAMKVQSRLFLALLIITSFQSFATDTVRVMTYNLMYYRSSTSFCDYNVNPPTVKDSAMKAIVAYAQPDIILCQEMSGQDTLGHSALLNNALNVNGVTRWTKIPWQSNGSGIVGGIFYDKEKFQYMSHGIIKKGNDGLNLTRGIDWVHLYYRDSLHGYGKDTVYLRVFNAHLKAGSQTSDENLRNKAAQALITYMYQNPSGSHRIFGGDFNVKTSQEPCYQTLVNPANTSLRFNDPINKPGNWNNVYAHRYVHTQSTRDIQTNGGCFSGGGLDDRLDQILVSDALTSGQSAFTVLPNTYRVIGNDGQHFDDAINANGNSSVPANVLDALYNLSDHLPVVVDIAVESPNVSLVDLKQWHCQILGSLTQGFRIQWNRDMSGTTYQLSNGLGQILEQGQLSGKQLDLSSQQGLSYLIMAHPIHGRHVIKLL